MSGDPYHPLPPAPSTAIPWRGVLIVLAAGALGAHAAVSPGGVSSSSGDLSESQTLPNVDSASLTQSHDDFFDNSKGVERLAARSGAEQIFQGELSSVKAVADFSRGTQTLQAADGDSVAPLMTATGGGLKPPAAASLTSADLSETIFALQSDAGAFPAAASGGLDSLFASTVAGRAPRKAMLMFWEEADGSDGDVSYSDLAVEAVAAAGGRGNTGNVLIPLPAAAWSGLSLMGGVGAMAGLRRLRQRLR